MADLVTFSSAERIAWGRELGRRFRDACRVIERQGHSVESWQLDEIYPSASKLPNGPLIREFMRATLFGLHHGRPELGDQPRKGFVYFSGTSLSLVGAPIDPGLKAFFTVIEASCECIIGEEYPVFTGDPRQAARDQAKWQNALAASTDVRAKLAKRYMAGVTPGLRIAPFLGRNKQGWPMAQVDAWRDTFLDERSKLGVAGIGEFDWVKENSDPAVMSATLDAVDKALPNIH